MRKIVAVSTRKRDNDMEDPTVDSFLDGSMGLSTNFVYLFNLNKCRTVQNSGTLDMFSGDRNVPGAPYDDLSIVVKQVMSSSCTVFSTSVDGYGLCPLFRILINRMKAAHLDSEPGEGRDAVLFISTSTDMAMTERIRDKVRDDLESMGFTLREGMIYTDDPQSTSEIIDIAKVAGSRYSVRVE